MDKIRVLIADDHDLIRQGIKKIIECEESISIIGEASNGNDLIVMIRDYKPDVVVTDMHMPPYDGVDLIRAIKSKYKDLKVIVVSMEDDKTFVKKAIELGVEGYLLKESAGQDVVNAIQLVYNGDGFIDKSLVSVLMSNIREKNKYEKTVFDELTSRELEILNLITLGKSNREIGDELFLAEKTVKNYSTKIFRKLDVKDRVHTILLAVKENFEEYYKNQNSED